MDKQNAAAGKIVNSTGLTCLSNTNLQFNFFPVSVLLFFAGFRQFYGTFLFASAHNTFNWPQSVPLTANFFRNLNFYLRVS